MNKKKNSLSKGLAKQKQKELKAARASLPTPSRQYSDGLTLGEMLKKYPKKIAKHCTEILNSLEKNLAAKEQKKKKHSKRTTPSQVDVESPPAHIHVEGKRWVANLRNQNSTQRKRLAKHTLKQK